MTAENNPSRRELQQEIERYGELWEIADNTSGEVLPDGRTKGEIALQRDAALARLTPNREGRRPVRRARTIFHPIDGSSGMRGVGRTRTRSKR